MFEQHKKTKEGEVKEKEGKERANIIQLQPEQESEEEEKEGGDCLRVELCLDVGTPLHPHCSNHQLTEKKTRGSITDPGERRKVCAYPLHL